MKARWANPEQVGVIIIQDGRACYFDSGPIFEEAVAAGPEPYGEASDLTDPSAPIYSLAEERAAMVVSRFQAKAALFQLGLLEKIETLLAGAANYIHRLAWDESTEFHRDSPTLNFLAVAAGLSEAELDDLFRLAMTIRA
jgi:hypothetical protein